jgi:hypothetical protein
LLDNFFDGCLDVHVFGSLLGKVVENNFTGRPH